MKAMVLAAGLGTRLLPLTADRPKALVTVAGRTLLEITFARLREVGIYEVIVNAHHFADQIESYLEANRNFGMRIEISREESLLDTGGGLKQAAWFFLGDQDEPFLVHNVDVISNIDLGRMLDAHRESGALATLAVKDRPSSRYLLFDEHGLCGRRTGEDGEPQMVHLCDHPKPLGFCGIHVISPRFLTKMSGNGAFSIISTYLDVAAQGERIAAFRADAYAWRDLGRPESLAAAEREIKSGMYA